MASLYQLPTQTIAEAAGSVLTITITPDGRPACPDEVAEDETGD